MLVDLHRPLPSHFMLYLMEALSVLKVFSLRMLTGYIDFYGHMQTDMPGIVELDKNWQTF